MKYSYNWLRKLSGTKKDPNKLAKMVGLKGFEFEEKEELAGRFENFVVGEVLEVEKHPDADKLRVAKVNLGEEHGEKQIVCGAPNIEPGQKVPVALVGAIIPLNKFEIEKTEIRGVESSGMLCAEDELVLGKDHEGILILSDDAKAGDNLVNVLELDDTVLDFDVLPNRAHDCLSYEGMAREIAAMEDGELEMEDYNVDAKGKKASSAKATKPRGEELEIEIQDEKLCPRYLGAVLENVKIGESPQWMKNALVASGMEPINNVVDITNYVMLEVGNPLHAFDNAQISSGEKTKIVVRTAKKGEVLELLDGTKLELNEKNLVIANPEKVLALAGIKGGLGSGINSETNKIVLEAANFDAFSVRKTRQEFALNTEAQTRFEKTLSPELAKRGLVRAIQFLEEHAGAKLVEVVDADHSEKEKSVVKLSLDYINRLLGKKVETEKTKEILTNLGFEIVEETKEELEVKTPFWRMDVDSQEDLIEDVGRMIGYSTIEEAAIVEDVAIPRRNESREFEWKVKDILAGLGMSEVKNYSFYGEEDVETCGIPGEHFELANPLTAEHSLMRKTLLPGLVRNVVHNEKYFSDFAIFEVGKVYEPLKGNVPKEVLSISGAVFDKEMKTEELFFVAKGKLEEFLKNMVGEGAAEFKRPEKLDLSVYHAWRSAIIKIQDKTIGVMGEIDGTVAKKRGLKNKAILFEIDFDNLRENKKPEKIYEPLRKFPVVLRDIAMFVEPKKEVGEIEEIIQKAAGEKLLEVELFDVFEDKEKKRKSLAFHLTFGDNKKTLESEEIDDIFEGIVGAIEKDGGEVRIN